MNRLFKVLFITLAVLMLNPTLKAQNNRQNISREKLAETQARHIASELAFNADITARFMKTYCNCQKEIWELDQGLEREVA